MVNKENPYLNFSIYEQVILNKNLLFVHDFQKEQHLYQYKSQITNKKFEQSNLFKIENPMKSGNQ